MHLQLLNYITLKHELHLNNTHKLISYFGVNRASLNYTEKSVKLYKEVTALYCENRKKYTVWGKLQCM